jgi:hypothetical protein
MYVFTVPVAMFSSTPISVLDSPRATSVSTWASRGVRPAGAPSGGTTAGATRPTANDSISRRSTGGASVPSPAATARTAATRSAGSASFSR